MKISFEMFLCILRNSDTEGYIHRGVFPKLTGNTCSRNFFLMKILAVDSGTGVSGEILEHIFDDDELLL